MTMNKPASLKRPAAAASNDILLGTGAYGTVFLRQLAGGEKIAVKKFLPPTSKAVADRCKEEVRNMYKLNHPNVVATVETPDELKSENLNPPPEIPYLCMEYCSGGDLRKVLKNVENLGGLSEREARAVIGDISNAILYLHTNGIIHRDISPGNIVIQKTSNKCIYKLCDLGMSKDVSMLDKASRTLSYNVGTPLYVAPEVDNRGSYRRHTKTVDFWSFGLIAYEVAYGTQRMKKCFDEVCDANSEQREFVMYFPPDNNLSQMFQHVLRQWLPSMIKYDPKERGTMKIGEEEISALDWMVQVLNTAFMEIHTPSERLVCGVGKTTTMSEINNHLAKATGYRSEDQMLLTKDGTIVKGEERALEVAEASNPLYLIPTLLMQDMIDLKPIVPPTISSFLIPNHVGKINDPIIWIKAFCVFQNQIKRTESLLKALNALRSCKMQSSSGASQDQGRAQELSFQIRERFYCLKRTLGFIGELTALDESYLLESTKVKEEITDLAKEVQILQSIQNNHSLLTHAPPSSMKPVELKRLLDLYQLLVKHYKSWENASDKFNMNDLRVVLAYFFKAQTEIHAVINQNTKALLHTKLPKGEKERQLSAFKGLLDEMQLRTEELRMGKLKMILDAVRSTPAVENPSLTTGVATPGASDEVKPERLC